jgi:hypothetical protein
VLPRLSSGDQTLWEEFSWVVSINRRGDAAKTADLLRTLPIRGSGHTHVEAYDFVLLVPVRVDNLNPPSVARRNALGIDVDVDSGS